MNNWPKYAFLTVLALIGAVVVIWVANIAFRPKQGLSGEQFRELANDLTNAYDEKLSNAAEMEEARSQLDALRQAEVAEKDGQIAAYETRIAELEANETTLDSTIEALEGQLEDAGNETTTPGPIFGDTDDDGDSANSNDDNANTATETAEDLPTGEGTLYIVDYSLGGIDGDKCAQLISAADRQSTIAGHAGPAGTTNPFGNGVVDVFYVKADEALVLFANDFENVYVVDNELQLYASFFESINPTASYPSCEALLLALGLQE